MVVVHPPLHGLAQIIELHSAVIAARPHVRQLVAQLSVPNQRGQVLDRDRHPDVIDGGVAHRLYRPVRPRGTAKQPDIAGSGLVQRPLKRHSAFLHARSLGTLFACVAYGSGLDWPASPAWWRAECWSRATNAVVI